MAVKVECDACGRIIEPVPDDGRWHAAKLANGAVRLVIESREVRATPMGVSDVPPGTPTGGVVLQRRVFVMHDRCAEHAVHRMEERAIDPQATR